MEKLADRFVLEREVGAGGMSTVYLGRDEVLGRPVAVKVLKTALADTDIGDRFQREGKTAARLSHPNIVPVYDAGEGEVDGREVSYIVMEYIPGGDLKRMIDERGSLGAKELAKIGSEVANGLAHAHARSVVHRDIKPHNILLDPAGRPKLTDFGIARALEATRYTRTGSFLGTALYASPEQLKGEEITPKSDVYSFGATLYQAATGTAPFQGTPIEIAEQHLSKEPPPPTELVPGLDREMGDLILACLAKDPEKRPSATEIQPGLLGISEKRTPRVIPADSPKAGSASEEAAEDPESESRTRINGPRPQTPASSSRAGRSRGVFAALAAAFVVLAVVGVIALYNLSGESPERETAQEAPQNPPQNAPQQGQDAGSNDGSGSGGSGGESAEVVSGENAEQSGSGGGSNGLSEEAAASVVEGFYTTAAAGDYGSSSGFLSTGYQSTFPDEGTFEGTFGTLESISFVGEPEVEISGDSAVVNGTTEAVHTDRTERNTATWRLVEENGEWKLDDVQIQNQQIV